MTERPIAEIACRIKLSKYDPFEMSENDAMRIARDQIGKLNAQVNQDRQEAIGLTGYIWRTMNDDRVRDEHAMLEGEAFTWDDPPEDGPPGDACLCRCFGEPDFSPIIADTSDRIPVDDD